MYSYYNAQLMLEMVVVVLYFVASQMLCFVIWRSFCENSCEDNFLCENESIVLLLVELSINPSVVVLLCYFF